MEDYKKYLGSCENFSKKYNLKSNCCISSHEDYELGYEGLMEFETREGYYLVCYPLVNELANRNKK